jgi:hypothetical protein
MQLPAQLCASTLEEENMSASDASGDALPTDSVAELFRTSSFCTSGACVEVAALPSGQVAVRDSKNLGHPALFYSAAEWREFVAGVKAGEFDF